MSEDADLKNHKEKENLILVDRKKTAIAYKKEDKANGIIRREKGNALKPKIMKL